jgi:hypothetical protein
LDDAGVQRFGGLLEGRVEFFVQLLAGSVTVSGPPLSIWRLNVGMMPFCTRLADKKRYFICYLR